MPAREFSKSRFGPSSRNDDEPVVETIVATSLQNRLETLTKFRKIAKITKKLAFIKKQRIY